MKTYRKNRFVQNFIPVRNIKYGLIETTDNRYIKILEIEPINFMLRSEEEQIGIISAFASWLKISPVRIQFKSIVRKADSEKHISILNEELVKEENEHCRKLGEGYIQLIKDVGNKEALTRRFFLIFQYEFLHFDGRDEGQIYGTMQTIEQNARAYFALCGNSIIQPRDVDEATAEILYMFFNRRSCFDEPFSSRVERVVFDTMMSQKKTLGLDPVSELPIPDLIAPRGIDLSHATYVIMDGLYFSFLFVKGDGYPGRVRAGWTSALVNAGEGIDVDIFLTRENRSNRQKGGGRSA